MPHPLKKFCIPMNIMHHTVSKNVIGHISAGLLYKSNVWLLFFYTYDIFILIFCDMYDFIIDTILIS